MTDQRITVVHEGETLWCPAQDRQDNANLSRFQKWLQHEKGLFFPDYLALHSWSVNDPEGFWRSVWTYFDITGDGDFVAAVQAENGVCGAKWFEGVKVNYAEHLLRFEKVDPDAPAICYASEESAPASISRCELSAQVRKLATALRALGVKSGDRVVSYMPNVPETAIAMMAAVSIGAVWASAAPEFGAQSIIDRFAQLQPKVVFVADGYRFGGKCFDRREHIMSAAEQIPNLLTIVWLPLLDLEIPSKTSVPIVTYHSLLSGPEIPAKEFQFERVSHDHPLWILFSSGTTGVPKAIAHSHPGVLAEHFKSMALHLDISPSSRVFIHTTPGWMMWNTILSSLLVGACAILYDGSPTLEGPKTLWSFAEATRCTLFGASPSFIRITGDANIVPKSEYELSAIETLLLGGAPSGPEIYSWIYENVKDDVWVCAPSGGTEIVSAFVTGNVTAPVCAGEIQALGLGMNVQVWNDEGQQVFDEIGELVVTSPFPSAPLFFWGDTDGHRYHETYFEYYPGVWRHGDLAKMNTRGGTYIYGRSDSTLNRYGVRIGTAEIYAILARVSEVRDSLVVCCEHTDGSYYMPLFICMEEGESLTDELRSKIVGRLRREGSPRHVPDEIVVVPAIPYTTTGKKLEVPIRKLLMGFPAAQVASWDALADRSVLDWFLAFVDRREKDTQQKLCAGDKL